MKMPEGMHAVPRFADNLPVYAVAGLADGLEAASPLGCALCCSGKSGFGACVARCLLDGKACDGGVSNCTPC
jgi:hypothetical protein